MNQPLKKPRPRRVAADEAHAWARNLRLGNHLAKLVLSMVTLYVNGDGICFVGAPTLADDCELSVETVRRRLAWLEEIGAITRFAQWIDENGRRNGDGRGKRTTDEIRLMMDADPDAIEARARGLCTSDAEVSPLPQRRLNGEGSAASPPAAPSLQTSTESSEPEPEESPQSPPSGGDAQATSGIKNDELAAFQAVYPDPITDYARALSVWRALSERERQDALTGARGYAAFVANERAKGRSRTVKNAHLWLQNRMWLGYLDAGKGAEAKRARCDIAEGSEEWGAWEIYYRCCGQSGIPEFLASGPIGNRIANVAWQWPPAGRGLNPDRTTWRWLFEGSGQFAAWCRRLSELPNARVALRRERDPLDDRIKGALRVPCEWPPSTTAQAQKET